MRNTLVIPIIEEAIAIRKRRSGAYADSDPSIACDKVLIACRLASIDGDYIGPAKDAYNIFQKFSVPGSASLKPFSREILKLSYILAYELRARAKEMATLASSNFDPGSPSLGEDWYSLGLFYEKLGEYAKSITAYETSYNVDNARKSTNALCSARAMAKVYYLEGDYELRHKAKFAEELYQKAFGPNYFRSSFSGMQCLENLTAIARARGDLGAAETYARQLILPLSFKTSDGLSATHSLELASILALQNKTDEAKAHAQKAVTVLSNVTKKSYLDDTALAKAHGLLAALAILNKDYKLADAEYRQAFNYHLNDDSIGGLLGRVADNNGLAVTAKRNGLADDAAAKSVLYACIELDQYIDTSFAQLSLAEQCAFIKCVRNQLNPLLSLGVSGSNSDLAFQYVMHWQGLLIEAVKHQSSLEQSGDARTVEQLRRVRQELSQASSGARGDANA